MIHPISSTFIIRGIVVLNFDTVLPTPGTVPIHRANLDPSEVQIDRPLGSGRRALPTGGRNCFRTVGGDFHAGDFKGGDFVVRVADSVEFAIVKIRIVDQDTLGSQGVNDGEDNPLSGPHFRSG